MEETESLNSFHSEEERRVVLTPTEKEALLRADPSFRSVASAAYFDNYDLPCPVQVTMEKDTGERVDVVLRRNSHGDVVKEIHMFAALGEFGMPVPAVLVEPFHNDRGESEAVYSLLSGENLQKLSMRSDEDYPWLYEEVYRSAMAYLKPVLEKVDMPLVISNGDYQPGNFLAKDGKITGYLDFESASLEITR